MRIQTLQEFSHRVKEGGRILRTLCSTGEPTENQVKQATRQVDLPISFEEDLFLVDPIRSAVFVAAYEPARMRATPDQIIERSWNWYREHNPAA